MMASSKDELTFIGVGLGSGDPPSHEPSSFENVRENMDIEDNNGNNISENSELGTVERGIETSVEAMQTDCDDTGEQFYGDALDGSEQNEDVAGGEVDSTDAGRNANEDDKLLSEISELVDQKDIEKEGEVVGKADSFNAHANGSLDKVDIMKTDEGYKTEMDINEKDRPKTTSDEYGCSADQDEDINAHDDVQDNVDSADMDKEVRRTTSELKTSKESAVKKLASLGLITEEEPIVEDKETILKKLASRGGISIMPAGSMPSSAISPITNSPAPVKSASIKSLPGKSTVVKPTEVSLNSVTPASSLSPPVTPTKPPYKPGPKSAKKKIKIDPGKSADIDKDFTSLISFLSAGTDVSSTSVTSSTSEEKDVSCETVSEKVTESKPEAQLNLNEVSNQSSTNDGHGSGMDVDTNEDKSYLESETESHDGSKFELNSENDEKTPVITQNKNVIEEGSAEILLSANKNVFYNKVQEFNRDMSIAALTVFSEMHQQDPRTRNRGKKRKAGGDSGEADSNHADGTEENIFEAGKKSENGITILEALSASGLRSIRYAREIPGVKEVIANDLSEDAVDTIKKNLEHNGVEEMVKTSMSDASLLMYQHQANQEWYDAVDLDPYGCPARFLDAAVQAVRDGGLLLVTCTDMAILAGNAPETCYVKYGAVSLRMPACHEMALRIALQCIESHANRYGRYIVPLISFSADFYIRLIVQVYTSPVTCKRTTSKLAMVYQCTGCGTHSLHPLGNTTQVAHNSQPKFSLVHGPPVGTNCFHCHYKHIVGGPIWTAPLYSPKFVESMLKVVENGRFGTFKRMQGMLELLREELLDVPLYYTIAGLCTKLHCQAIPLIDIRSAILNAGYRVSSSHTAPTAIKTNAPSKIIWDIMRCWVHMNPVSQKRLITGSVSAAIILEPPNLIANFDIHPRARPSSAMRKLLRYQQNPQKNWGPGTRARCNNTDDTNDEKRKLNQNKNKNKKHIDIIEVVTIDDEDETTDESKLTETVTTPTPAAENE